MADHLIIERLEFQGCCGVTLEERQIPQPIAVDLELLYPSDRLESAASSSDLARAIDYAAVAGRIIQISTGQAFHLLETLAESLTAMLFAEFPVSAIRLWVRKVAPPLKHVRGSVGVRLERTRLSAPLAPSPAQFLQEQLHRLPKGRALDVAAGYGRNALYLAAHGYSVEAVDRDEQALASLAVEARERNLKNVTVRRRDLEIDPDRPPDRPSQGYDVILVFFYLYRPLFPALLQALKPGGVLMYETFLIDNHQHYQHPRRPEFCLARNELLHLTADLRVLYYEEGEHPAGQGGEPAFTARLMAERER
jgi:FolB domain-containing protein